MLIGLYPRGSAVVAARTENGIISGLETAFPPQPPLLPPKGYGTMGLYPIVGFIPGKK